MMKEYYSLKLDDDFNPIKVSPLRAWLKGSYNVIYYEGGKKRYARKYIKRKCMLFEYHLKREETIEGVVRNYDNWGVPLYIITKEYQESYLIQKHYLYESKILDSRTISVFDEKLNWLYYQEFKENNEEPFRTRKFTYNSEGDEQYIFEYKKDGMLERILDMEEDMPKYCYSGGTSLHNFSWEGLEYYKKATPIIPE